MKNINETSAKLHNANVHQKLKHQKSVTSNSQNFLKKRPKMALV